MYRPSLKTAGYALLGVVLAVLYANWTNLEVRLQLTVEHHALSDPQGPAALKTVTVFANGMSTGGVEVQVSGELLERKNASELAEYFAQFVRIDTDKPGPSTVPTPEPTPTSEAGIAIASEASTEASATEDSETKTSAEETKMPLPSPMPSPSAKPRYHRLYTGTGQLVRSFAEIETDERLYVVAPGLLFVWPFVERGHRVSFQIEGQGPEAPPLVLESISESPRIFRMHNFATEEEVAKLTKHLSTEIKTASPSERHPDEPQTTGISVVDRYTDVSTTLRKRAVAMLSIGKFRDQTCDGLELTRYEKTQAAEVHLDVHDFDDSIANVLDPRKGGCNRFATVITYLSDVAAGGQTVFPDGERLPNDDAATTSVNAPADNGGIAHEGWEHELVEECASHLVATPRKTDAMLVYNLLPNGDIDETASHGSCPVLAGTKDTATLYIWSACPAVEGATIPPPMAMRGGKGAMYFRVTFHNPSAKPVDIYRMGFKEQTLQPHMKASFQSYSGLQWTIKYGERVLLDYESSVQGGSLQKVEIPMIDDAR